MAVFLLETDSITSSNSSLNSLVSQLSSLSSTISGYDVSDDTGAGFDFAGAKSKIASNVTACSTKIQNTIKLVEKVIEEHTNLQNSFKYDIPGADGGTTDGADTDTGTPQGTDQDSGKDTDGGGNYYGGGGGAGAAALAQEQEEQTDFKKLEVKIDSIGYATADVDKLSEDSQTLFKRNDFTYDTQNGYAMIGNRYVIACDQSYGNVGDVVAFIQKDGTSIECVIGAITASEDVKNKVRFFVNPDTWTAEKELTFTKNLAENTVAVYNRGNVDVLTQKLSFSTNASTSTSTTTSAAQTANLGGSTTSTTGTTTSETGISSSTPLTTESTGTSTINVETAAESIATSLNDTTSTASTSSVTYLDGDTSTAYIDSDSSIGYLDNDTSTIYSDVESDAEAFLESEDV